MTWHPIKSIPPPCDRLIEVTTFPARSNQKTMVFIGEVSIASPKATHWREITRETAEKMGKVIREIEPDRMEL